MKANISLQALMNRDTAMTCSHVPLDPFELSELVPKSMVAGWTSDVMLGWQVFCAVLPYAIDERRPRAQHTGRRWSRDVDFCSYIEISVSDTDMSDEELSEEGSDLESDVDNELCSHSKLNGNFYRKSKVIGTLWAAIQTELLTYRRLTEG